jgi:hypothetical protein
MKNGWQIVLYIVEKSFGLPEENSAPGTITM